MGSNTLNNRSNGQTILDTFFNDIHQALDGDLVGRGATGIPTPGQNLGTVAIPWGIINGGSLVLNGSPVDTSQITSPANRVISGKKRSISNQPAYITPNGAAASFIVAGATTNLAVDINGAITTIITDITKSGLTPAPNSNNTALVNDTSAAGQSSTRTWGEYGGEKDIIIDTAGSNITAKIGKYAAFKIGTEYFMAFVESSTLLSKCYRGYFYDPSLNPIKRVTFSNNDTITLMNAAWIFIENDASTVDVTYNAPVEAFVAPSGPVTGDYWYDLANNVWKRYDGATFQIINRTYIGIAILDSTNCVAARSVDFYARYDALNTLRPRKSTGSIMLAQASGSRVSVAGNQMSFPTSLPSWNLTTDLAPATDMYNASVQNTTMYYLYVSDQGKFIISDIEPYYRGDLWGLYHPYNPWRMVGTLFTDGSANIESGGGIVGGYRASAKELANISVSNGNTDPMQFDTLLFDSHDCLVGISGAVKARALFNGIYDINAITTAWGGGRLVFSIFVNGTEEIRIESATADSGRSQFIQEKLKLNAGDYVEIFISNQTGSSYTYGDTGATYNGTRISIERLPDDFIA